MAPKESPGKAKVGALSSSILRSLPSVDRLLRSQEGSRLVERFGHALAVESLRATIEARRSELAAGGGAVPGDELLLEEAEQWLLELVEPTLRPVINATGVIVHTNLGRAPLSDAARAAAAEVGRGYSNLEYDLEPGARGSRAAHAEHLLQQVTGAEAALVVNNNAAAVLLMLSGLCNGREVLISRGQLVEIGGGFRVPDVMAQSGARLVEVGTTNRTHIYDYADALGDQTVAILVAHHSNFKIVGFTSEPNLQELSELTSEHGILLLYDQGSGALLDTSAYGLDREPTVVDGLRAGADLVSFSGDKLLGGPQAGIICGRANLVGQLKKHPLARAVRPDKLCLASLSATLASYATGRAIEEIPVWRMISRPLVEVEDLAEGWVARLREVGLQAKTVTGESTVGGGSLPGTTLPTALVAIEHPSPDRLARQLRHNTPPIIGRIGEGRLLLDPRTVMREDEQTVLEGLLSCLSAAPNSEE
ncbi:MAG: L-seryl-tRNA(Sec) selenium transferase [Candidatus Promineifilaceae bacterium]